MSRSSQRATELLVLMYHHIHGASVPYLEGLHGPTVEEFESQLQALQSNYQILDYRSFLDAIRNRTRLPSRCALITFDDGTVDHYRVAFPILAKLGVSGTFFVITEAVQNRTLSAVHARHLIAGRISETALRNEFSGRVSKLAGKVDWLEQVRPEVANKAYRWDDPETARFKYAVNFGLSAELRNTVLREIFEEHVGDWSEWGARFYVNWQQLREMKTAGMEIGGHSHRHEALSLLSEAELDEDIRLCHAALAKHLDGDRLPFSYPFGKAEHFSANVVAAIVRHGFSGAFTNVQGTNLLSECLDGVSNYSLRRIDPKDLARQLDAKGSDAGGGAIG